MKAPPPARTEATGFGNEELYAFVWAQATAYEKPADSDISPDSPVYLDLFHSAYSQIYAQLPLGSNRNQPDIVTRAILQHLGAASIMSRARFGAGALGAGIVLDTYNNTPTPTRPLSQRVPAASPHASLALANPEQTLVRDRRRLPAQPDKYHAAALLEYIRCSTPRNNTCSG
jgi:hypothetical protein